MNPYFRPGIHNLKGLLTNQHKDQYVMSAQWNRSDKIGASSPFDRTPVTFSEFVDPEYIPRWQSLVQNNEQVLSGITWEYGCRRGDYFIDCGTLFVDIDEGIPSIAEVMAELSGVAAGLIYHSKSHLKPKHEQPSCERYRIVIPLDRPVTSVAEYRVVMGALYQLVFPEADYQMKSPAWYVRGGCSETQVYWFGGHQAISVDAARVLGEQQIGRLEASRPQSRQSSTPVAIPITCTADGNTVKELEKIYRKKAWKTSDTYRRMYGMASEVFKYTLSLEEAKAALLGWGRFAQWLSAHPNQATSVDKMLVEGRDQHLAESLKMYAEISPPNEVIIVAAASLYEIPTKFRKMLERYFRIYNVKSNPLCEATYKLFYWSMVTDEQLRTILSIPCGLHKSTSLTCWAAAVASAKNQIIIVKGTIEGCITQRDQLVALGAESIGVLIGFNQQYCQQGFKNSEWFKMYGRTSHCNECPFAQDCLFGNALLRRDEQLEKDIVIITHQRYQLLNQSGSIPEDATIVVDEALAASEGLTLSDSDWAVLEQLVPGGVASHRSAVEDLVADHGCRADKNTLSARQTEDVRKALRSYRQDRNVSEKQLEILARYQAFFSGEARRYVIKNDAEHIWLKSIQYNELPNRIIILDGSAKYSAVEWRGFRIYTLAEHQQIDFSNLTLHAHIGNPTKKRMEKDWDEFSGKVKDFLLGQQRYSVFVGHNKGADMNFKEIKSLLGWLQDNIEGEHVHLPRGKIIGSNEARNCDVAVIATSIFTSVPDYVLRCALVENGDITWDRIWKRDKKGVLSPKMNHGFEDDSLNLAFRRQYTDELYQSLMRIKARNYQNQACHVFAFIADYWLLEELNRNLRNYKVVGDDVMTAGFRALEQLTLAELETISLGNLYRKLGGNTNTDGSPVLRAKRNFEWCKRMAAQENVVQPPAPQLQNPHGCPIDRLGNNKEQTVNLASMTMDETSNGRV